MLLLHGFAADRFSWLGTAPALSEAARVLAADLPSHGSAADERVTGFAALIDDALVTLEGEPAWQRAKRRHVIGHSLGGALAIAVASRSARPVHSLSAIAPIGLTVAPDSPDPPDSSGRTRRTRRTGRARHPMQGRPPRSTWPGCAGSFSSMTRRRRCPTCGCWSRTRG